MLLLGGRAPLKILFAKNSGRVIQQELSTWYSDRGSLERLNEPVPFRLTRNMATFFTSFGVEGVFMAAMANAAQAILHKSGNAQHVLALFFRDDFSSWHAQKNKITAGVGIQA
jgi:transformation/transcription domain-associated protein